MVNTEEITESASSQRHISRSSQFHCSLDLWVQNLEKCSCTKAGQKDVKRMDYLLHSLAPAEQKSRAFPIKTLINKLQYCVSDLENIAQDLKSFLNFLDSRMVKRGCLLQRERTLTKQTHVINYRTVRKGFRNADLKTLNTSLNFY